MGRMTIQQIAAEYEIHPTQVLDWKKILANGLPQAFESKRGGRSGSDDFESARQELHSKIEELTVKLDFVVKKQATQPVKRAKRQRILKLSPPRLI